MILKRLDGKFFSKDATLVAKNLLGKTLVRRINGKILRAKIVETEAYLDENDPGSRARQKGNLRETMLMSPGTILVYGIHNCWLLNFITGKKGKAEGVLLRALEPLNFDLNCSGPGKLTKSLNIDKKFHGKSLSNQNEIWIENGKKENHEVYESFRIGLREDLKEKIRFYIKGNKFISKK